MSDRPRIVFMGTPAFAVPSLEAAASIGDVVLVVTQPDRRRGRGHAVAPSAVKEWALARGLPVRQPQKLKATRFHEELHPFAPDVAVVTAYGRLLPPEVLAVPARGCVNLHASLLPKYRGAAPIQWAVASGETETGVCLMLMEEGLDTGPVIARTAIPIGPGDTAGTMHDRLARLAATLLTAELPPYLRGERVPVPQDHGRATLAPPLRKEDGRLDFRLPARVLSFRVRGFSPWPGAFTVLEGKLLKILRAAEAPGGGVPGEVLSATPSGIEVACGEGTLVIEELQLEGKRPMRAQELLAGHRIRAGARLG
jgi:methionyl-tRNA formyltransferase